MEMDKRAKRYGFSYLSKIFLLIFLGVMVLGLSIFSPYFLTWNNIYNILDQSSIYFILAVGMTFVICSGGIDLSVGSVMALSGVMAAMLMQAGVPAPLAVVFSLIGAIVVGLLNGIVIAGFHLNAFIVTLCTMSIIRGLGIVITDGKPIYGFDTLYRFIGSGLVGPLNVPIILAVLISCLGAIILRMTTFGNYCYVLGDNPKALRRMGIRTAGYQMAIYGLSALCAGIAGLIVSSRLNTAEPLAGMGYEMDAIAAVVLGGTSLQGGEGGIGGTVIACLVLGVMKNGLTLLSISANYQMMFTGLIVLCAVLVSEFQKRREKGVREE